MGGAAENEPGTVAPASRAHDDDDASIALLGVFDDLARRVPEYRCPRW
jgi:hypothetical protein